MSSAIQYRIQIKQGNIHKEKSRVSPCGVSRGQRGTGRRFCPSIFTFPCRYHANSASYSFNLKILLHGKDRGRSLGNFKRSSDISEIGEH